ncbi:MAG: prolipoprotein diacylglyceryl transferase [Bacillota bacterium]|nr:prolipoprotein diacylglyceryl transferase [Bacillota bacterium]MDW7685083.1 prolipoprotein diacylglyceryl transferase [Bacillota bacterium]
MSAPTVLFQIGNFPIHLFGVMVAFGILAGFYVTIQEARRMGLNPDKVTDLALVLMIGGILGARILYVLLNFQYYLQNPVSVLHVSKGGLSFHGAAFAGVIIVYLFAKRNRVSFLSTADLLSPGFVLGYAVGRLGCDIYGNAASVPWAVTINGIARHPVQFYSAFIGFVIFASLWSKRKASRFEGEIFLLFATLYSGYRFFIEFFRNDGSVTPAQIVSIFIAAVCLIIYRLLIRQASLLLEGGRR